MTGSNFSRLQFSSACKVLSGDDIIWLPDAILLFLLKTTNFTSLPAEAIVMTI